jgi:dephospho-CoA kinase
MGKSTTAAIFARIGLPVWDADKAVHRLYAKGGAAVLPLSALVPTALCDGAIDRSALKTALTHQPALLQKIEKIVHPLVYKDRTDFLDTCSADIAVFDIPLLFEKGTEAQLDAVLLVTAPADLQRARVMARAGMTEAQFSMILARQMPDAQKRARATHIVETLSIPSVEAYVSALVDHIRKARHA